MRRDAKPFLQLCDNDADKVKRIDQRVAEKIGFDRTLPVTGQTYPRKFDSRVLNVLAGIAQSAHKFSNDMRLLQSCGEMEEPFGKSQVGSSTMAYKRNPVRSERMAALARHVICTSLNPAFTAAGQWFERTIDDSANKRLSIPEAFLATDSVLILFHEVARGMVVYPAVMAKRVSEYLPFLAAENLMMDGVKAEGDRQDLHEKIRHHAIGDPGITCGWKVATMICSGTCVPIPPSRHYSRRWQTSRMRKRTLADRRIKWMIFWPRFTRQFKNATRNC